ncbi:MAG: protein-L-isoaspartate O-methyltransferase [Rhodobacteraceae bacterium]|nr:protein-L-isoaspartate O-methyltransferase [Paracoccaceae bacterium]
MADTATLRRTMVDTQVRPSDVTKFPIIEAMLSVPREVYMPDGKEGLAYIGAHVGLAPGRVILDPRVFAKMLDAVDIGQGDLVLDLGCGMGYSTAILARMAQAVIAVEEVADWAAEAESLLGDQGVDNAVVIKAPLAEGGARHGPYDAIVLNGAVARIPAAIAGQLKTGGRIVALFMDGALGECRVGHKSGARITWRMAFNATAPVLPGFEVTPGFAF